MKRWKLYSFVLAASIFFIVNIYLIVKDDSKVERTVFVKDWTNVKKQDIREIVQTKGVIKPKEEYPVYYRRDHTEFQKFLVQEGDEVTTGTPLFEYTTPELDTLRADMEAEKNLIKGQITGIDTYIGKLQSYQATMKKTTTNKTANKLEADLNIEANESADMITSTIEQEIYKQELEKSNLEEKITKIDTQLGNLAEGGTLTIASETKGIVKHVDQKLGDPIMTIASSQSSIEGVLNEKQFKQAEPGMKIKVTSKDLKNPVNGTLERVNAYPTEDPAINKTSTYLFDAVLPKQSGELVNGSKVGVAVITAEAKGVPAVPDSAVRQRKAKPFLYRLTSKGLVNKEYIDKGLKFDGKQEVKSGVKVGDIVALSPEDVAKHQSIFITPLDIKKFEKAALKKLSKHQIARYVLVGMFEK